MQKAAAKNVRKFIWTEECQRAYELLREELKSKFLICPDFEKEFILDTDACLDGISGILSQEQESIELPVGYFSKALSETEIKYPIIEKELNAVVK